MERKRERDTNLDIVYQLSPLLNRRIYAQILCMFFLLTVTDKLEQAGAELGQAQLKLGLDFSVDLVTLDLIC